METILVLVSVALLQLPLVIKNEFNFVVAKNTAVIYRRGISVLLMLPLLLCKSFNIRIELPVISWFLLYFNVNLVLSFFQSLWYKRLPKVNLFQSVNLRKQPGNSHILNAVSWIIYITAYEIVIRVIFINELISSGFSFLQAAITSFIVYVIMHFIQGYKITAGAFVFGIIATAWLIFTASIVPVIILHVVCALGNDYAEIWKNDSSEMESFHYRNRFNLKTK